MAKKTLLILFLLFGAGQVSAQPSPFVKSLILPGWGESSLNKNSRARIFYSVEGTLWTSFLVSGVLVNYYGSNSKSFAAEYAGVNPDGKNSQFWIDIGNYDSRTDFNEEHLRWRDLENLYGEDSDWTWISSSKRDQFERIRIKGDQWALAAKFLGAGLVLNRIVSFIDVLYLNRLDSENITLIPEIGNNSYNYKIVYRF